MQMSLSCPCRVNITITGVVWTPYSGKLSVLGKHAWPYGIEEAATPAIKVNCSLSMVKLCGQKLTTSPKYLGTISVVSFFYSGETEFGTEAIRHPNLLHQELQRIHYISYSNTSTYCAFTGHGRTLSSSPA